MLHVIKFSTVLKCVCVNSCWYKLEMKLSDKTILILKICHTRQKVQFHILNNVHCTVKICTTKKII